MKRIQIGDTPLSIAIYSAQNTETIMHEPGMVEIIFCLKGSVSLGYAYEDFHLEAGDFVLVDKDAYYLENGKDNICVSYLIDITGYEERYPGITDRMFICEGIRSLHPENYANRSYTIMKGLLLAVLNQQLEKGAYDGVNICDTIVALLENNFDIIHYYNSGMDVPRFVLERHHRIHEYVIKHFKEKITLTEVANEVGLTESYCSEFMRMYSVGFRGMLSYIRANHSEKLLLNTNTSIIDISEECGFSDVKYYYVAFKKWYHCTPKQFRMRFGKERSNIVMRLPLESIKDEVYKMIKEHFMDVFVEGRL